MLFLVLTTWMKKQNEWKNVSNLTLCCAWIDKLNHPSFDVFLQFQSLTLTHIHQLVLSSESLHHVIIAHSSHLVSYL